MTWNFRFSCTGCGKCCNSSPSIYLNEIIDQADMMLFRPSLRIEQVLKPNDDFRAVMKAHDWPSDANSSEKTLKAAISRLTRYGVLIKGKASGRKLKVFWSITDLSAQHLGKCPFRSEDMSCEIYEDRPIMCRAVPFGSISRGLALQSDLEEFTNRKGYMCDTSETADILVENGRLAETGYKKARTELANGRPGEDLSWIPRATMASLDYIYASLGVSQLDIARMYASGEASTGLSFPFGIVLFGMIDAGSVSIESGIDILRRQIKATADMRARLAKIGLLHDAPPVEAPAIIWSEAPVTWDAYIEEHKFICEDFIEILETTSSKSERIAAIKEISSMLIV